MKVARKQLIIIPGLGDRGKLYRLFTPLWALYGFDVHTFVFGWDNSEVAFDNALGRLLSYTASLAVGKVYIIGISAGGTAAINALAEQPEIIAQVVTVCTPYARITHLTNKLLNQSINRTIANINSMNPETKAKIFSIHGIYDQVVSTTKSSPNGIAQKTLWSVGHGLTIFMAMTAYSHTTKRILVAEPLRAKHGKQLQNHKHLD